jgi:hypothetical protein
LSLAVAGSAMLWAGVVNVDAWDYEGYYVINQFALASLPKNFPAFALTPAARKRIAFLVGKPDRWRTYRRRQKCLEAKTFLEHQLEMRQRKKNSSIKE